jgi:hypothetical protein
MNDPVKVDTEADERLWKAARSWLIGIASSAMLTYICHRLEMNNQLAFAPGLDSSPKDYDRAAAYLGYASVEFLIYTYLLYALCGVAVLWARFSASWDHAPVRIATQFAAWGFSVCGAWTVHRMHRNELLSMLCGEHDAAHFHDHVLPVGCPRGGWDAHCHLSAPDAGTATVLIIWGSAMFAFGSLLSGSFIKNAKLKHS